ncbi:MAG: DUF4091 domain-containing protein [Clostridia bacterium]|nr:DUF4091 domain-containing protein [Clostridia bacterium]
MVITKLISSLEKCFLDEKIDQYEALERATMLKNERYSFQMIFTSDKDAIQVMKFCKPVVDAGALTPFITIRTVEHVPVTEPVYTPVPDDNYLRTTPGIYPDLLMPLRHNGTFSVVQDQLRSVWIEVDPRGKVEAGSYPIVIDLYDRNGEHISKATMELEIIDASLPEQELIYTQWFHCDSLAHYYRCEVWSEEHWTLIERFARTAVRNGINLLLTPVHTPPLDTKVGGERLTVQLVDVTLENGKYHFGFDRLDRWIDMCNRVGIRYFEIAHLFTQWGAAHAPKIMATVDGEYKKLFGWETDATGEDYVAYLRAFLPAFLTHMKARGDDRRCFFHISDEPNETTLPTYCAAKDVVAEILADYPIMDALSSLEFYEKGIVKVPVPANDHIQPFIEAGAKNLWSYHCCLQGNGVSNRFVAMPLYRTRSLGMQLYKYDIVGFLHWGYNHYLNVFSEDTVEPFLELGGEDWVPAGDAHSVYPSFTGYPLESMRIVAFFEGLQDQRAMKLAEQYYGKEAVVAKIEELFGEELRFDRCAKSASTMKNIREAINGMIKEAVSK